MPARKCLFSITEKGKIDNDGKVSDGHISLKDYLTFEKIWDKFDIKDMGDYQYHYLKDVLLLADVFEKSIETFIKYYGLDLCHYFSPPGLNWDAMLKMTGVKLEKISDIDRHLFIEKGLRVGISYIAKIYAKANNKYMNDFDPKKPSTFITYLDINNLYGWAMSEYLPYGEFKWLKNVNMFDVNSIDEKSLIRYFLKIDLEYPDKLHELNNDDPLAPEKFAVSSDMLPKYCKC